MARKQKKAGMSCAKFRELHPDCSNLEPNDGKVDERTQDAWLDHLNECQDCGDWYMGESVKTRGEKTGDHPCVHLAYYGPTHCAEHPNPFDCPDVLVMKFGGEYGLPVRDGGTSYIRIDNCPWCGKAL